MNQINPLAKKLLIKPNKRWLFVNAPDNYHAVLEPLPEGVTATFEISGDFDGIQLFVTDRADMAVRLKKVTPLLKPDTIFWICYPKKSSGIKTDLEMTGSWDEPTKYGIEPVAAASIDHAWTGLRFRQIGLAKTTGVSNGEIKQNEYAEYVDVENKQVKLPPAMLEALEKNNDALSFYQRLSYSNRKEYVMWILTAKQEKTKAERLEKLIEKLSAGKKNPSEK
jgi:hypothetical protein